MKAKLASAVALLALAGFETTPFSYIDGNRFFKTDYHNYSVIVLDVDGRSDTRNPVMVEPGNKVIRVQGPPANGFPIGVARDLTLDVKPCTRYYLRAVKRNPLEQDFVPEVDHVERIAGCTA